MPDFKVEWLIDIGANDTVGAAKEALRIQRDPDSQAVVFNVYDNDGECTRVDLLEEAEMLPVPCGRVILAKVSCGEDKCRHYDMGLCDAEDLELSRHSGDYRCKSFKARRKG